MQFIKKEIVAKVFSCDFSTVFKNDFFIEHRRGLLLSFRNLYYFLIHFEKGHANVSEKLSQTQRQRNFPVIVFAKCQFVLLKRD